MKSTKTVLVVVLSALLVASALVSVSETINRNEAAAAAETAGTCVLSSGEPCGGWGCGGGPERQGGGLVKNLIAAKEEAEKGSCSAACDRDTCESCPNDETLGPGGCDGNCADCDEGCYKEAADQPASVTKDPAKTNKKTAEKPAGKPKD